MSCKAMASLGEVGRCEPWHGEKWQSGPGMARTGMAWRGETRFGKAVEARSGRLRRVMTSQGKSWQSWQSSRGMVRYVVVRWARQGEASMANKRHTRIGPHHAPAGSFTGPSKCKGTKRKRKATRKQRQAICGTHENKYANRSQ